MNNDYEYKDRKLNYIIVEELIIQLFEGKGFKKVPGQAGPAIHSPLMLVFTLPPLRLRPN